MFNHREKPYLCGIRIHSTLMLTYNRLNFFTHQNKCNKILSNSKTCKPTLCTRTLVTVIDLTLSTIARFTTFAREKSLWSWASTTARFSRSWEPTRKLAGLTKSNTYCLTTWQLKECRLRITPNPLGEGGRSSTLTTLFCSMPSVSTPPPSSPMWSCTSTTRAEPWGCSITKDNIHTKSVSTSRNSKSSIETSPRALRRAITHVNFLINVLKTSIRNSTTRLTIMTIWSSKKSELFHCHHFDNIFHFEPLIT